MPDKQNVHLDDIQYNIQNTKPNVMYNIVTLKNNIPSQCTKQPHGHSHSLVEGFLHFQMSFFKVA